MKYDIKKIMKRAWEIKNENTDNIFSLCLKKAWIEAKIDVYVEKLEKIVKYADGDGRNYRISVNNWMNYGKSRTYFSIIITRNCSTMCKKVEYGYFDNNSQNYVAGKHDLEKNYSISGEIIQ